MYCPECGHENDADAIFCDECGNKLLKTEKKERKKRKFDIKSLNWKAILIGLILGTVLGILILAVSRFYLGITPLPILIGVIVGFIADGSWKKGAIHGGVASSIIALISMIILFALVFSGAGSSVIPQISVTFFGLILIIIGIIFLIIFFILGAIGGALGAWIKGVIK
jgi:predicted nucleic acid-binding Zn ribbon protein